MDTQDSVDLVNRMARREAIAIVLKVANYLDRAGAEDLADDLMDALRVLKQ